MIATIHGGAHDMLAFETVDIGAAARGCVTSGTGPPLVFITSVPGDRAAHFHGLVAEQLQVFVVSVGACDAATIGRVLQALGLTSAAVMCRGADAHGALDYVRSTPAAVSHLILIAPQTEVGNALLAFERPVLVLEGTRSSEEVSVGQRLTTVIPECYDVLVYDTGDALDSERPEAVAEVVTDFVQRGGGFIVGKPRGPIHP